MKMNRAMRVTAAGFLMLSAGYALAPHTLNYVSTSAVVNAPLIVAKSPFDGRIAAASPATAHAVWAGTPIVRVEAERQSRAHLNELLARQAVLLGEIEALAMQEVSLKQLDAALAEREALRRDQEDEWMAALGRELEADLSASQASHKEIEARFSRIQRLHSQGASPKSSLDELQAALARATGEINRTTARLEALAVERAALALGIFIDARGGNSAIYSRQRRDEITMRLTDVAASVRRLEAEQLALVDRIADARRDVSQRETFSATAAVDGVIWRASAAPGAEVLAGDEILQMLDCERRFLEVAVAERHFDRIQPGSSAEVRLRGGSSSFTAVVTAVRGSGAKFEHPALAAETPDTQAGQLRVLIALANTGREASVFCDVGRTAEVRFPRDLRAYVPEALTNLLNPTADKVATFLARLD